MPSLATLLKLRVNYGGIIRSKIASWLNIRIKSAAEGPSLQAQIRQIVDREMYLFLHPFMESVSQPMTQAIIESISSRMEEMSQIAMNQVNLGEQIDIIDRTVDAMTDTIMRSLETIPAEPTHWHAPPEELEEGAPIQQSQPAAEEGKIGYNL